jgi:putative addiction module antidote
MKTKIRKIGNSYGIVLPKEILHHMKVKEGDTVYISDAPQCAVRVTPDREKFDAMMRIAEEGMRKYRNTLKALAQ